MTVIITSAVITLIIISNDTIISLSAGVLLGLQANYCVCDGPGAWCRSTAPRSEKPSPRSHTYFILPLIISFNLVNYSEKR